MNEFISNSQISQFKKDGAIFLKSVFDMTWIEKLKRGIETDIKNPTQGR
jgi:hypothetical protein